MKIFTSDTVGIAANCVYPHGHEIADAESLRAAVCKDYVCAAYKNDYRSNENFLGSDCLPADCDNDHSEDPKDWVTPEDVADAFPGVRFGVHYSRNHMREKGGRAPRPKFHVLFPIPRTADAAEYAALKRRLLEVFPYFDKNALDAARFFFGTADPRVEWREGDCDVIEFMDESDFDQAFSGKPIAEGSRNSTLSRFAGRVLIKYGETDEAAAAFEEMAERCDPPLGRSELDSIWNSALRFYRRKSKEKGYVPPERYNDPNSYKPGDYSDVGQAEALAKAFSPELRYSPQTGYLRYRAGRWAETEPGAQAVAQELTRRQMKEARELSMKAAKAMADTGARDLISPAGKPKGPMNPKQLDAYRAYLDAKAYSQFALERRDSRRIQSALKEARPLIEIDHRELDGDPFLLNTPEATYDLRKGMAGAKPHSPDDLITKITSVSPGDRGKGMWEAALRMFFGDDGETIAYVQSICGLAAIGRVYVEALIIAYGEGGNGKSTFWNAVARCMGDYYGNISADTLTVGVRRNVKPEMAEVRGKRLLIAAESQEGARLNESTVKQLSSTDDIFAEKKYRDPFAFKPTHTLILYTNHLPKVSASDDGIWRRLIVIPFSRKISGSDDQKNYADRLVAEAGPYILKWVIEGAERVIAAGFRIAVPPTVSKAIEEYRESNDWLGRFLDDRCELDPKASEPAQELYKAYVRHCQETFDFTRPSSDFYAALERAGLRKSKAKRKTVYVGVRLLPPTPPEEDFLN